MKEINDQIKNVVCPFCDSRVTAEQVKNLVIRKMMPLIIDVLKIQGFEIRKIKRNKK